MQELLVLEPKHIAADGSYFVIEQAVVMEKCAAARPSLRIATGQCRFPKACDTVQGFFGVFPRNITGNVASPICPVILLTSARNSKKKFPQLRE